METRTLRVFSGRDEYPLPADSDIGRIVQAYHAWRGEAGAGEYKDVPGFCKSATIEDIKTHGFVLTPGRYIDATEALDDGEDFQQKMRRITAELDERFAESDQLSAEIRANLARLGYGA